MIAQDPRICAESFMRHHVFWCRYEMHQMITVLCTNCHFSGVRGQHLRGKESDAGIRAMLHPSCTGCCHIIRCPHQATDESSALREPHLPTPAGDAHGHVLGRATALQTPGVTSCRDSCTAALLALAVYQINPLGGAGYMAAMASGDNAPPSKQQQQAGLKETEPFTTSGQVPTIFLSAIH